MILIKYGELTTKKGNRNFFVKTLKNNLETKLKNYNATITMDLARMYITYDDEEEEQVINAIKRTLLTKVFLSRIGKCCDFTNEMKLPSPDHLLPNMPRLYL